MSNLQPMTNYVDKSHTAKIECADVKAGLAERESAEFPQTSESPINPNQAGFASIPSIPGLRQIVLATSITFKKNSSSVRAT